MKFAAKRRNPLPPAELGRSELQAGRAGDACPLSDLLQQPSSLPPLPTYVSDRDHRRVLGTGFSAAANTGTRAWQVQVDLSRFFV